jgi:hypothetical protein
MDRRLRVASFTLRSMAHPHTLMMEDAAIFGELSQNTKNGAGLHPRCEWPLDRPAHRTPPGREVCAGLSRARRARVKAVHRFVTLAQIAVAPVDSVDVSSEGALREVCEAHIRRQRLRPNAHSNLLLSIEERERPHFEGAKYMLTRPPGGPRVVQPKLFWTA